MLRICLESLRVRLENFWRVELRIERNRQQMPIRRPVCHPQQFLLHFLKIARHLRTKIRQRTTRENKGNSYRVTFELPRAHCLPKLVRKMIFRQCIANLERLNIAAEMEHTRL